MLICWQNTPLRVDDKHYLIWGAYRPPKEGITDMNTCARNIDQREYLASQGVTTKWILRFLLFAVVCVIPSLASAGVLLSDEAESWLTKDRATRLEAAIARTEFGSAFLEYEGAMKDHGLDVNLKIPGKGSARSAGNVIQTDEMAWRVLGLDKQPPAEVVFGTVVTGVLANKSNLGYALLGALGTVSDEGKELLASAWLARASAGFSLTPKNPMAALFAADAYLRNSEWEKADELLRALRDDLQQESDSNSRLLSLAYNLSAQSQMQQYAAGRIESQAIEQGLIESGPSTGPSNASEWLSARKNLAVNFLQLACGIPPEDTTLRLKPAAKPIADSFVSYAFYQLSKLKYYPKGAVKNARLALEEEGNNVNALTIVTKFGKNASDTALQGRLTDLLGTQIVESKLRLELAKFNIAGMKGKMADITASIRTVTDRIGGVLGGYFEGLNFSELKGSELVVSSLSYPGMLRPTAKEEAK